MTNYNEGLDEVLRDHRGRALTYHEMFRKQHHSPLRLDEDLAHADAVAKQAVLDWHNKQIEAVLDRLYGELMEEGETIVHQWQVEGAIAAERAKLKEVK